MGRRFGWFWGGYGVSALGTWLAFGAFPLIAVQVLHAGPAQVALLSATATLVGAAAAVPLGAWVEHRRRRPVLVAADLVRCAALLTVPLGYALGVLRLWWLAPVAALVAAADITFRAASGAYLRDLLPTDRLLRANARLEATGWTATAVGPPLGGALVALLGPVATVAADAVSYLLSASALVLVAPCGLTGRRRSGRRQSGRGWAGRRWMGRGRGGVADRAAVVGPAGIASASASATVTAPGPGAAPVPAPVSGWAPLAELFEGWRLLRADPVLWRLLLHTALFNGLVTATEPLLAVLMLGQLGFAGWQYGLAFALPALGGLLGARLARPLAARYGERRVLLVSGTLRALWPLGLVLVGPGTGGLLVVLVVEAGLILCCAVFNPLSATWRLRRTDPGHTTRVLAAWSVTTRTATAVLTAGWGVLGSLFGPRAALGAGGVLLLAVPLLLPFGKPVRGILRRLPRAVRRALSVSGRP
ncbi:MFS transporter [Kitasatospora sp. NPDC096147]|uniref:MFS transporter n=1 Tax=Kitasatospora sp. NPDC096147 TaxID=3364093 RepID=UPI0037F14605